MNIFYTNSDPVVCAREHCNVHRNKMIIEYCQLMSTAHHVLDGRSSCILNNIMKPSYINHPSAKWVRVSSEHYEWLYQCTFNLLNLYQINANKIHACSKYMPYLSQVPVAIKNVIGWEDPYAAMPVQFKLLIPEYGTAVAYRAYLNSKFRLWRTRPKPMKYSFTEGTPLWYNPN